MIKCYKLLSGEEIIAKEKKDNGDTLTLKTPAIVVVQEDPNTPGKFGIGLAPMMGYAKNHEVEIQKTAISATAGIETQLENEYNRAFGAGIQLPTPEEKKILLADGK